MDPALHYVEHVTSLSSPFPGCALSSLHGRQGCSAFESVKPRIQGPQCAQYAKSRAKGCGQDLCFAAALVISNLMAGYLCGGAHHAERESVFHALTLHAPLVQPLLKIQRLRRPNLPNPHVRFQSLLCNSRRSQEKPAQLSVTGCVMPQRKWALAHS